jgi:hypothetical protein
LIIFLQEEKWTPEERAKRIDEAHARMKQLTSDGLSEFDKCSDDETETKGKGKGKNVKVTKVKEELEDDLDAFHDEGGA